MKRKLNVFLLLSILYLTCPAQNLIILQIPQALEVNAGNDQNINQLEQVILGGNPTAAFGLPPYSYNWSPATYLNDATLANPLATPEAGITYSVEVTDANGCSVSSEISINVITDLDEIVGAKQIFLYPNPAKSYLYIDIPDIAGSCELSVIDIYGRILHSSPSIESVDLNYRIDVSMHPAGIYLVRLKNLETVITETFLIK